MLETLNAIANVATLLLLTATAIAGIRQLRHLDAGNQLAATSAIEQDFRAADVQAALRYVQEQLATRMADSGYRRTLAAAGYIDPVEHPEMILCNWFNRVGALLYRGLVAEEPILELFGRLIVYYWELLKPTIAVLRRTRGPAQYAAFEYLADRAGAWVADRSRRDGRRPTRVPLPDPWLALDRAADEFENAR
jgi:hypothetical protein